MSKTVVLMLFALLAMFSLVMIGSAFAQSIPKPSVPEFTVVFFDNSYDVLPRYDIDPYTGKDVIMEPGYHVQEKIVEVVIDNQPFISYEDVNGNIISLYYSIRIKGSFEDSWAYPDYSDYLQVDDEGDRVNYNGADPDSYYTVVDYGLVGNNGSRALLNLDISDGGKADFQVQAFVGYRTRVNDPSIPGIPTYDPTIPPHHYVFTGEESGWSGTQTLTIEEIPPPPTPMPHEVPEPSELEVILGIVFMVAIIGGSLGLMIYLMRRK